jgi:membrane protein YdbS with pleckstrin-like domain
MNTHDANEVGSPEANETGPGPFLALDGRVVGLWRLTGAIGWGIVLLAALAGSVVGGVLWGGRYAALLAAWVGLAGLAAWWVYWYPARSYRAWGYRIDARVLETREGVWFQVVKLLPLSRLQHVDLQRGPLERAHGLASLVLHTAGTHEATLVIPGLDAAEAARLRDCLVAAQGDDGV